MWKRVLHMCFATVIASLPMTAWADGNGNEEPTTPGICNICELPPETLTNMIQACQMSPGGTLCLVLSTLAGIPPGTTNNPNMPADW